MAFKPLYDRVVLKRNTKTLITPGGIQLSDAHTPVAQEATVISVGPGTYGPEGFRPTFVKPGDKVLLGKGAGVDMEIDGQQVVFALEANILGVC